MVNEKCHVFTPTHIVNKMLDEVNYKKNYMVKLLWKILVEMDKFYVKQLIDIL